MGWSGDSKQIVTRITGQRHTEALWPLTAPVGVFFGFRTGVRPEFLG
jgi:hypothetical protein